MKDIDPLIDTIESALTKKHVHTVIIRNEPYPDVSLSRNEAKAMVFALKQRIYDSMN